MILADSDGDLRLWLRAEPDRPLAVVLPFDDDFDLRLGVARRLLRRLRDGASGPWPPRLAVTRFQRLRLTLLLNIFDRLKADNSKREIARELIYPGLDPGPSAAWKASSERRRTQRLCDEARAMVAAGYRHLLRGK
ncbi:MAG: DUF2285 domain-containing protein [Pseudomonadota bacterium]|nr:DUF2285 domain-containing protein [Pseudomonadota bacterium]